MPIPHILISGVTSADPDFTPLQSKKQQLLADARITRWYVARDGEVTPSTTDPTKVAAMIDRKGAGPAVALAADANRPALVTPAGLGGRKALSLIDTASAHSLTIPAVDFSGSFFIAALVARSSTANEVAFSQGNAFLRTINNGSAAGIAQFFARGAGINVPLGTTGLDTAPRLLFASHAGGKLYGAQGRGTVASGAATGAQPNGDFPRIGQANSQTPEYFGGHVAQILFGTVDILAAANADLRELICGYIAEYYGLTI